MKINNINLQSKHFALIAFTTLMLILMVVAFIGSQKNQEIRSRAEYRGCDPNDKTQDCNVKGPKGAGCTRDGGTPDADTPCCSGCERGGKCVACSDTGGGGGSPTNCRQECRMETYCEGCWDMTKCTNKIEYNCRDTEVRKCDDLGSGNWNCYYTTDRVCDEKCAGGSGWKQCCTPNQTRQVCSQVCDQPKPVCDSNKWGSWSACSASCGGGTQTRTNACGTTQTQSCNTQACAIPTPTFTPTPTPTPTLTPTPTPTLTPGVCARKNVGDANCDGKIDGVDYSLWLNSQCHPAAGQICNKTEADFNKDGNVDDADYQIWFTNRRT